MPVLYARFFLARDILETEISQEAYRVSLLTVFSSPVMKQNTPSDCPLQTILPFKDQKSADQVRRHFSDIGRKINYELQPVFTSKKIIHDLHVCVMELKPPLVNSQNVVYEFQCDLCDANYVGYTCHHLQLESIS